MDAIETLASRPVVAASAVDRAYDWLRDEVLSGRIAAPDLVTEGQIADAVGVSRTPVREALVRLQAEGFVRLVPKRGALVLPVSREEAADVMEARRLLESFAVRKAVGAPRDLAATLRDHVEAMRGAAKQHDVRAFVEADRAFHAAIVAATGNRILVDLYRSLRDRQLRMAAVTLESDSGPAAGGTTARMRTNLAEHEAIVEAIESRSVRAAEAAVTAHLDSATESITGGRRR